MSLPIRMIIPLSLALSSLGLAGCQSTQKNQIAVDYYSITGNSTADLDLEIKRKGPKINGGQHAVAIARIKIFPVVTYEKQGRTCKVASAKVTVDARVTLPKWKERDQASEKLGRAWDNIERYTREHEATHVDLAFTYARNIEQRVKTLPEMNSCDRLRKVTKQVVDRLLAEHDAAQKKYDADEQARFIALARKHNISGTN